MGTLWQPASADAPGLWLRMVQADYGDCLILESNQNGNNRYILIDGGPDGIYDHHLKSVLQDINAHNGRLDLVILSHIDEDHVVGLVDLMADIAQARNSGGQPVIPVDELWYNTFRPGVVGDSDQVQPFLAYLASPVASGMMQSIAYSISQGEDLLKAARILEIPLNQGFTQRLVTPETAPRPVVMDDLRLWVLGPLQPNLERYRKDWLKWYTKHKADPFAASAVREARQIDKSVSNLSSIMFLAEIPGRRILLTGDGRGDDVLVGIQQTGLANPDGTCPVDVLKVPHHGSERNSSQEFYRKVPARQYVIPAGKHKNDGNPDLQTLVWIVESAMARGAHVDLFIANPNANTKALVKQYPPETSGYSLTFLSPDSHSLVV